ncbi:putative phage tail assembly chaperone [Rodentibacter haemolyticus]|uniref:Phage tail assembly chaperone n=1 Tax=Rodentibacter haemolyticus TaxID=2778911 RepID=A0ABX6UY87_9PAST|nr:putative phage tail assembly chaperone [Rodentibacter haemolyticus]QPB43070.1 putative phage tail assembly chaperone [Rodentibacter haemolyticus]
MEKTQAQTLLEKLTGNLKDSVVVNIAGVDFTFIRDNSAFDQMINDMESNNKVTPFKDYLLAIVAREQKEDLLEIINVPGLAMQVAAKVNEVFVPQIEVNVKN